MATTEEAKAKRKAGMDRARSEMTIVQGIRRGYVNGRPPISELRTPLAAASAARALHSELESKMVAAKLTPGSRDLGVSVGFVTADLTVIGFTNLYDPKNQSESVAEMVKRLDGNIAVGLVFGMADTEATDKADRIVMGSRPFLVTKLTDAWLEELRLAVRSEIALPN
jgi:hypothetical protein